MDSELIERLQGLEKILAPTSLLERARTFAFSCHGSALDLVDALEGDDGEVTERYERADEVSRQIGREVARNEDVFKVLLPEIVRTGGPRLHSFLQGFAEGTVAAGKAASGHAMGRKSEKQVKSDLERQCGMPRRRGAQVFNLHTSDKADHRCSS